MPSSLNSKSASISGASLPIKAVVTDGHSFPFHGEAEDRNVSVRGRKEHVRRRDGEDGED